MRLTVFFLLALLCSAAAVNVTGVSVRGNGYVSDSLIVRTLGLRAGQAFMPAELPRGVRDLFALGYFT
ncbi:MAG TPA: hypothetical protein PLM22_10095, partial [Candidatus Sabulitectum sp.]|nr:hypothetical protein [Candidatus Sabulitectum sp.]HPJ29274.1 hypothetical protein [Candidatus Sabulitectum sp.]